MARNTSGLVGLGGLSASLAAMKNPMVKLDSQAGPDPAMALVSTGAVMATFLATKVKGTI